MMTYGKRCKERNQLGPDNLQALPEEIVCQIVKHLEFRTKLRLQLVCKRLYALLSCPPSGQGLWGECHLSADLSIVGEQGFMDPLMRR